MGAPEPYIAHLTMEMDTGEEWTRATAAGNGNKTVAVETFRNIAELTMEMNAGEWADLRHGRHQRQHRRGSGTLARHRKRCNAVRTQRRLLDPKTLHVQNSIATAAADPIVFKYSIRCTRLEGPDLPWHSSPDARHKYHDYSNMFWQHRQVLQSVATSHTLKM